VTDDGHAVHGVTVEAEAVAVVDAELGELVGRQEGLHRRLRLGRQQSAVGERGGEHEKISAGRLDGAGGAPDGRVGQWACL
jgi:hypothetical protein